MAELVILGSGTSNGVPSLAKEYPPEFLADSKNHRTRCSALLRGPGGNVLVDASPDMRAQLLQENVMALDAVIISHTHADHIMGLDDVRAFCLKDAPPMPLYTSRQYQDDIRRIFAYAFEPAPEGVWVPRFHMRDVPELLNIAGLKIQTFWVEHGPWPVLGMRVGGVAYITDVSHINEQVLAKLRDLDALVLDAVRIRPHPHHFNLEKALQVASELRATTTYLTHLSDDYDHSRDEPDLPPGIKFAYDGLRIPLQVPPANI